MTCTQDNKPHNSFGSIHNLQEKWLIPTQNGQLAIHQVTLSLELENLSIEESSDNGEDRGMFWCRPTTSWRWAVSRLGLPRVIRKAERRERSARLADRFEKRSEISEWYVELVFINNLCSDLLRLSTWTRWVRLSRESFPCFGSDKAAVTW